MISKFDKLTWIKLCQFTDFFFNRAVIPGKRAKFKTTEPDWNRHDQNRSLLMDGGVNNYYGGSMDV